MIAFDKLRSMQSPMAIAIGWEKETFNPYWIRRDTGQVYKEVDGGFIEIKTQTLDEVIASTNPGAPDDRPT